MLSAKIETKDLEEDKFWESDFRKRLEAALLSAVLEQGLLTEREYELCRGKMGLVDRERTDV